LFHGYYTDGKTAERHEVSVELVPGGLRFREAAGTLDETWSNDDLRRIEDWGPDDAVRLSRRSDARPRLVIVDPTFADALKAHAPEIARQRASASRRAVRVILIAVAAILIAIAGLWFGLPFVARPIAAIVPEAYADALGRRVASAIIGKSRVCTAPAGQQGVDRLVQRLATGALRPLYVTVQVIDKPIVNAIATPGGRILVFSGLIRRAESPDEFAGVLAHEISHEVHRHGLQALVRHMAISLVLTATTGHDWGMVSVASGAGEILLQRTHTRAAESEADATGLDLLRSAGIGSEGLAAFFAHLAKSEERAARVPVYLRTHPPSAERQATAERARARGEPAMSASEWQAVKAICQS